MERRILSYRRYMDELLEKLEKAQALKKGEGAGKEKSWTTPAIRNEEGQKSEREERKGEGGRNVDLEELKKEHLTQIGFFQHERLIHLIVTVVFALMEMLSLIMTIMSDELFPIILTILILVLLLPYIRHYYILENEVQKMYAQYDRISQLQNCNSDVARGNGTEEK